MHSTHEEMGDPYAVLGLSPDADDVAARKRYLELVKSFPPERDPECFARIQAAYEQVRQPEARLKRLLFRTTTDHSLDRLIRDVERRSLRARLPVAALLALAKGAGDEGARRA